MDHITMSKTEREQLIVFEKLKAEKISEVEAAARLGITPRWVRKKFQRYLDFGAQGLIHKGRGKESPKQWNKQEKMLMLNLLGSAWHEFGPTFTAEKLWEVHGIKVDKETVRQNMIKGGVWQQKRNRKERRKRRERRTIRGMMVQLDGSPHDWFEGRAPNCTLLVFIDDATSEILWLEFSDGESNFGVMQATKNYIEHHGRPHEFYVDFGSVFSVNLNNAEREKKTQWERAVASLSIRVIHAHSPQAKGRVERSNGTMQDRLVKELRLAGISSIEEGNRFLCESNFIAKHNARFAVPAAQQGDGHRLAELYDLNSIFCMKEERILANDYTIRFNNKIYLLGKGLSIRPKDHIIVNIYLDESMKLTIRNVNLQFKEIIARPQKPPQDVKIKVYKPLKPSENSKRWASGMMPFPATNLTQ